MIPIIKQNQDRHNSGMKLTMMSEAGKTHEKTKRIKPLTKSQREHMYAMSHQLFKPQSCHSSSPPGSQSQPPSQDHSPSRNPYSSLDQPHEPPSQTPYPPYNYTRQNNKKYSPFKTISRTARDSYLLRVTNQPNTQTNYEVCLQAVMKKGRRSTIDQAKFQRIIGPVGGRDFTIGEVWDEKGRDRGTTGSTQRDHRCANALKQFAKTSKPLTARQTHKWRKTHQNICFRKQTMNPQRNTLHISLKKMGATNNLSQQLTSSSPSNLHEVSPSVLLTLRETTQSNFNNYKRFSFVGNVKAAHSFQSDSEHKLMKTILPAESPDSSLQLNNYHQIKKPMSLPKGQLRFDLFRQQIKTRVDRADPFWGARLDYGPDLQDQDSIMNGNRFGSMKTKKMATIDFGVTGVERCQNTVVSGYPIRLALRMQVPNNRVDG